MFIDSDFPRILGAELFRPSPQFVAELAIEPVIVHDFSAMPGSQVQLDRYAYWGNPGTKESRRRSPDQTIGTASSRSITKQKVNVILEEYTGPADPTDPEAPSTFKVSRENLMTAQRLFLDTGQLAVFHQSIGSLTLLQDYRQWRDRVFINELYKAYSRGRADDTQGGYYFPLDYTEADLNYANNSTGYTVSSDKTQAKFTTKDSLLKVVKDMDERNVPRYQDGLFRCLCDPTFLMHLQQDPDFREVSRYPGFGMPNPLQPFGAPNAVNYMGMGPAYGQAGTVGGAPTMPTGFVYNGVRFFSSTNMPTYTYTVSINGGVGYTSTTAKSTRAAVGMFFGMQSIGVGIGGNNAEVRINSNDDFSRYIILIWSLFAGFECLNYDFITVAHSFIYRA